jgi:hypothetical protein
VPAPAHLLARGFLAPCLNGRIPLAGGARISSGDPLNVNFHSTIPISQLGAWFWRVDVNNNSAATASAQLRSVCA